MMSLRLTPPLSLLFLLVDSGFVVSQPGWSVYYTPSFICALKGSKVTMGCSYTYPSGNKVQRVFWSRELVTDEEPSDLSLDPKYQSRVQYLGDTLGNCSLGLNGVTKQDQGKYYFRFITTLGGKYQGKDGVKISFTELQVEMIPDSVVEGDNVTLTCKTICSLTNTPKFAWYKTGRPLPFISSSNPLRLQSVSQRDAGSYSCAVQGESYRSPAVTLDVQYSPKKVSVSISPSGEIVEGSSVTLTCSSDANPPVELYTWYKVNESSSVGSGQSYSFTLNSNSSGWFYCVAQNKYGTRRAAAVFLTLNGRRSVVLYVILGIMAVYGCLFGVLYMRNKRRRASAEDAKSSQENTYSNVNLSLALNNPAADPDQVPQDDVQYAVIQHRSETRRAERSAGQTAGSGAAEEIHYANVQYRRDRVVKKTEEDYDQYSNIRFNRTGAAYRSAAPSFEYSSVIYCS